MGLFLIDDAEFDEIAVNKNTKLLKKKYREAVKVYHPDNGAGDAVLFEKLQIAYDSIRLGDIDDIIDRPSAEKIYLDICEFQRDGVEFVKDIRGNVHKRKEIVGVSSTYVVMRLHLTVDEYEYYFEVREPHRLDNKYRLELRPQVNKINWLRKDKHRLVLRFDNAVDNKETKIEWSGNIKELNFNHSEFRANLVVKAAIQLVLPEQE